jgi:hypothetical protein
MTSLDATEPASAPADASPPRLGGEDMRAAMRLLVGLPGFLRRRTTPERARTVVAARLGRRGADFLALARAAVFDCPDSPYLRLLRAAGCEYGDLARLVEREGLEDALRQLCRQGVYLTIEEFKGRQAVVRGTTRFDVRPAALRNPLSSVHVLSQSSGSRGPRTTVGMDLAFVRDHAEDVAVFLAARGGFAWRQALWGVPGGYAMRVLLRLAAAGAPPVRWFSQIDPAAAALHPRYRWSARALRWGSLAALRPLPGPLYASVERPLPVARWMAEVLAVGEVPHLFTFPSSAVRLCEAAAEAGLPLAGARFWMTGEPITPRRLAAIAAVGADAAGAYGSSECGGPIAYGCLAAGRTAELHPLLDLLAVIQPDPVAGLPPRTLLFSSLRETAPFVLLNVSIGDEAVVTPAVCHCPLPAAGWKLTFSQVHSHAKITTGGMSVLDADVVRVLEEVLPRRFGGGPTDYQVVEDEGPNGRAVLRLLMHPRLGTLDPDVAREAFLGGVGGGSGVERIAEMMWREGMLQVERRAPVASDTGKIRHVLLRHPSPPRAAVS